MSALAKPGPTPTPVSRRFWEAAAAGRLELQRCEDCGLTIHYPRVICPRCWSQRIEWAPVSGRGTVKTFTVVHRAGHPAWQPDAPYVTALVELEEGPTMLSNIVDVDPPAVRVGMPVRVVFRSTGTVTLPQFAPVSDPEERSP